ncbi:MAG: hypothetical protein CMI58_01465 [Parcubacteria group bacterium]|nr:hypothetical protein [Parcubacteria group bacterium]
MKNQNNTLVFDIGKTNIKAILFNAKGKIINEKNQNHKFTSKSNHLNIIQVDKIYELVIKFIKKISNDFIIDKIIFTSHASTSVININESKNIILPVLDYENKFDKKFEDKYFKYHKCAFSETLTPKLSTGLVLSKTIYYYIDKMKKNFSSVESIIFYPQYFAWRLSGIKSSEITYVGCHSDLWSFKKENFSTFVFKNKLQKKIPKLYKSWGKLGKIKKDLSLGTKINPNCNIYCGLHDSNAAYYLYEKKFNKPFTLVSTGTWVVIFNRQMNLGLLNEKKEIFAKLNVFGKMIPVIRFMGGREYSVIVKKCLNFTKTKASIDNLFKKKVYAMPSFAEGGPFNNMKGQIINQKLIRSQDDYISLASLYVALITDYCLKQVDSINSIIIDGGFVKNKVFLYCLSVLRQNQRIFVNYESNGTATGAFLLCNKRSNYKLNLEKLPICSDDVIIKYKEEWLKLISKKFSNIVLNKNKYEL